MLYAIVNPRNNQDVYQFTDDFGLVILMLQVNLTYKEISV